jgi:hypothetical protein
MTLAMTLTTDDEHARLMTTLFNRPYVIGDVVQWGNLKLDKMTAWIIAAEIHYYVFLGNPNPRNLLALDLKTSGIPEITQEWIETIDMFKNFWIDC